MKPLFIKPRKNIPALSFTFLLFLFLFTLASCESEEIKPIAAKSQPENQDGSLTQDISYSLKKYYLTSRASQSMEYDENYRLKKVIYSPGYYVQYSWVLQSNYRKLTVKHYSGSNLIRKDVYTLNAQNKAIDSYFEHYANGVLTNIYCLRYDYNSNGKLIKFYRLNHAQEKTTFSYDPASGNLVKVVAYGPSGKVRQTIEYGYGDTNLQSETKDPYHFNPEVDHLDYYLKIYGSFGTYLPTKIKVNNYSQYQPIANYYYRYDVNPDGYPTARRTYNQSNEELVTTLNYGYLVARLGVQ